MDDNKNALIDLSIECKHDPLKFVKLAFKWGSGELAKYDGPDKWQSDVLTYIGEKLSYHEANKSTNRVIKIAVASGHGIGKSALVSWLNLWALSTSEDTMGVTTANTENQLRNRTWSELAKWHRNSIFNQWFKYAATSLYSVDEDHQKSWRIDAMPWSESNPAAFAGLHNQGKRIIVVFDEASEISDEIFEVSEGAMTDTDTEIIWLAFGNPTRNTGRFKESWGRFSKSWKTFNIDSRTSKITNKDIINTWIDDYGDDSDFVRIRVRGQFPRQAENQLISNELAKEASERKPVSFSNNPLIMGVDVAFGGGDKTCFFYRRGHDAVTVPYQVTDFGNDTERMVKTIVKEAIRNNVSAVFIDRTGAGIMVANEVVRLMANSGIMVMGIHFQESIKDNSNKIKCADKRTDMWSDINEWLKNGGCIPNDSKLIEELVTPIISYDERGKMKLEKKDDIRRSLGRSPDIGDALALTFAYPVDFVENSYDSDAVQDLLNYNPMDNL